MQRWPQSLQYAILIPPALLVAADFLILFRIKLNRRSKMVPMYKIHIN